MAPRRRQPRRSRNVGTTRMDAALDSMRQLGFDENLVRETVNELLDVYDGTQGWPFVEEASYKLLIETMLSKENNEPEKEESPLQDPTNDEAIEMSATPTGITDVGSTSLVVQDSLLQANDGVDSAFQSGDEDPASLAIENNNQALFPLGGVDLLLLSNETDVDDLNVPAGGGGREHEIGEETRENDPKHVASGSGSSREPFVSNVKRTLIKPFKVKSSKPLLDLSRLRCAWSGSDDDNSEKNEPKHAANATGSSSEPFVSNNKRTLVKPFKYKSSKPLLDRSRLRYGWRGSDDDEAEKTDPKPADNVTAIGNNSKSVIEKPLRIDSSRSHYRHGKPSYYDKRSESSRSRYRYDKPSYHNERNAFARNERNTSVRAPMVESSNRLKGVIETSSKPCKNPHYRNRSPCYGWMDEDDRNVELTKFPLPPLPEHVKKWLGKSSEAPQSSRQRRKSRWDEKPEGT